MVVERTATRYSAYVPDLPGCIAAEGRKVEITSEMPVAIYFYNVGMQEDGLSAPEPKSIVKRLEA
jgi:predicted RNase H-like HicB family nuclease